MSNTQPLGDGWFHQGRSTGAVPCAVPGCFLTAPHIHGAPVDGALFAAMTNPQCPRCGDVMKRIELGWNFEAWRCSEGHPFEDPKARSASMELQKGGDE